LGAILVRDDATGRRAGRIVEVEAYAGPEDGASHARFGSRSRNAVMFGPAGIAYVYLVYGMYDCLNVVTGPQGEASATLIRAVEPLSGVELMRADRERLAMTRRKTPRPSATASPRPLPEHRLASGPGLVGAAYGLDRGWTGTDLCDATSALRLEAGRPPRPADIIATPRVGIAYAGEPWTSRPWRLVLAGSAATSGPRLAASPAP
jgi:DNA-3-methyladenine glycosylase